MQGHPLQVAIVGFGDSALAAIELFLNRHSDAYVITPEEQSDAIIFNADQPVAIEQLQQTYQSKYNKPGIAITIQSLDWPEMLVLKKPYSTASLESALKQLEELVLHQDDDLESPDAAVQRALDEYRRQMRKGMDSDNAESEQLKIKDARQKSFQASLFERKRAAEKSIEQLKQDMAKGVLQPLTQNDVLISGAPVSTSGAAALSSAFAELDAELVGTSELGLDDSDFSLDTKDSPGAVSLVDVSDQDVQNCCGIQADRPLDSRAQRRQLYFNVEGQLLSVVASAIQQAHQVEKPVSVKGLSGNTLCYYPKAGQFFSSIDYDILVQMAQVRFHFGELQLELVENDQELGAHDFLHYGSDQLLWRLACWSSRGRIIEGVDLDAKYQLDRALPSNVILDLPYTQEMIALWIGQPHTAIEVMAKLGAEQRYVFPFMSAAWVFGWLKKTAP